MIDNKQLSFFLHKVAEQNRFFASENMTKSSAPNAGELCTEKLNFGEVLSRLSSADKTSGELNSSDMNRLIDRSTSLKPVSKSTRLAAIEFSNAAVLDLAMIRLVSHFLKQENVVIDNFRPS